MSINLDRNALSIPMTIAEVNPVFSSGSGSPQSDPGTRSQDPLPQSGYTVYLLLVARRGDLVVSTRKTTEEAAQVGADSEWEGQRKEEGLSMDEAIEASLLSNKCNLQR